MKQNITIEQFDELPEEAQQELIEWMGAKNYNFMDLYMTIGQMIEFLDEHNKLGYWDSGFDGDGVNGKLIKWKSKDNLCDTLWKTVKEILNKDE